MKKTKLNEANYYSQEMNKQYFSVSQYKDFCKCEAMAIAKINGTYEQPKSKALLLGSLVDELLTGDKESQDKFFIENKDELFKKNGEPYADVAQAFETAALIEKQPLMMKYLSGEKQKVMTGEINGVPFKIKMDSYKPGEFIADLKYLKDLRSPNLFESAIKYWQYDLQMAIYKEIVYQNTGERLPTFLVIGTKEQPARMAVCEVKPWNLDYILENAKKMLPRFEAVKKQQVEPERCLVCDYCAATTILTEPIDSDWLGLSSKQIEALKGDS
jgi:hypothetical protein